MPCCQRAEVGIRASLPFPLNPQLQPHQPLPAFPPPLIHPTTHLPNPSLTHPLSLTLCFTLSWWTTTVGRWRASWMSPWCGPSATWTLASLSFGQQSQTWGTWWVWPVGGLYHFNTMQSALPCFLQQLALIPAVASWCKFGAAKLARVESSRPTGLPHACAISHTHDV